MTLAALQHLIRSAKALAEDREFLVLGSASLLASFPDLGLPDAALSSTYDADICPQPYDEITAIMLDEALGENRAYYQRHGYHADILPDSIFETLSTGWRERLIPVPGGHGGLALEPHDLAAVKLLVGRPKDVELVTSLHHSGRIRPELVNERLDQMEMGELGKARASRNYREVFSRHVDLRSHPRHDRILQNDDYRMIPRSWPTKHRVGVRASALFEAQGKPKRLKRLSETF